MTYTLYYSPDSANLVIRMVLEELTLDYQGREVPRKRTDRDESFLRLNPRGLLPVLIDDDINTALFETAAILLYLADKHGALAPKPSGHTARGEMLKWLFMLSNTLHADLAIRFYPERYVTSDAEISPLLSATKRRVLGHIKLIEQALNAHDGTWLLADGPSICDFYLGCCVRWAQLYPETGPALLPEEVGALPKLTAMLGRLQQHASVQRALDRENIAGNAFIQPCSPLPPRKRDAIGTTPP